MIPRECPGQVLPEGLEAWIRRERDAQSVPVHWSLCSRTAAAEEEVAPEEEAEEVEGEQQQQAATQS